MPVINLALPIDNSFTNLAIYEGILFMLKNNEAYYNIEMIEFDENALAHTYNILKDSTKLKNESKDANRFSLSTTGKNDGNAITKLLSSIGMESKTKRYEELLSYLAEHSSKLTLPAEINLDVNISKKKFIVGDKGEYSLQLFKMERYTGITSTELHYITEQLTTYLSKEALLIALLGIYSSFITRSGNYYFLFFMPDEITMLLNNNEDIKTAFLIKDKIVESLGKIIRRHYGEELLITEIIINTSIQELLQQYNIDKISLLLVRVAQEGQTYKIYQQVPLIVQRRELSEVHKKLADILEPGKLILNRLSHNTNVEYNNLLSAIMGVYRYVVLNDVHGLFLFQREILNAYNKLKSSKKANERQIAEYYATILRTLGSVIENAR